jgi:hypothetical protein
LYNIFYIMWLYNEFFIILYNISANNIYIYVWKLNQTVLELDFRAVKFLFFFIILYNILKIAELDCCQIIILSIYVPSTHAYAHVLRLSLDLPYEKR